MNNGNNRTDELDGFEVDLEVGDGGEFAGQTIHATYADGSEKVFQVPGIPQILPDHKGISYDGLGGVTPTFYLRGPAGSGKSYNLNRALDADPDYAQLTATTGIAAVNLGASTRTIHSTMKCGRTEDFESGFVDGTLQRALREVKKNGPRWLVIDEVSMLHRKVLFSILSALDLVNSEDPDSVPLGLMLTGDFAQLPPIPGPVWKDGKILTKMWKGKEVEIQEETPWAFRIDEWEERFSGDEHSHELTKIWRQSNPQFLEALTMIRRGVGTVGAGMLKESGVRFGGALNLDFDGTTILAKNDEVDKFNFMRLGRLPGMKAIATSSRWTAKRDQSGGESFPAEWKQIPERIELKVGALVMILNNETENWSYVNGDTGYIREITTGEDGTVKSVLIELKRTGRTVEVGKISRKIEQKNTPEPEEKERDQRVRREKVYNRQMWILGEVEYLPVRVAYATTVHKSQGLTLDEVQIDPSGWMFSKPGMVYVAVSRCRTPEGLTLVGDVNKLAKQIAADPVLKAKGFL